MFRVAGLRARFAVVAILVMALCSFLLLGPYKVTPGHLAFTTPGRDLGHTSQSLLTGHAIAPKLGNATAKYVGHAWIWKRTRIARAELTRNIQSRTWSRGLESPSHNLRPLPREAYRGGERGATVICSLVPTPVPMVCLRQCRGSAAGVTRQLTVGVVENVQSTLDKCLPNTLPRCRPGQRQPCGAATYTTLSIKG